MVPIRMRHVGRCEEGGRTCWSWRHQEARCAGVSWAKDARRVAETTLGEPWVFLELCLYLGQFRCAWSGYRAVLHRARAFLRRLRARFGSDVEYVVSVWRFERVLVLRWVLKGPRVLEEAREQRADFEGFLGRAARRAGFSGEPRVRLVEDARWTVGWLLPPRSRVPLDAPPHFRRIRTSAGFWARRTRMRLKVGPAWTQVEDARDDELLRLKRLLTFEHANARWLRLHHPGWDGKARLFSWRERRFPSGLVEEVAREFRGCVVEEAEPKLAASREAGPGLLRGVELADFQLEAVRAAVARQRGVLALAVNAGKTEVALAAWTVLGRPRTLWLVHRRDLLEQVRERVTLRAGLRAGTFSGSALDDDGQALVVATVQAVWRLPEEDRLVYLRTFDGLVVDEVHHAQAPTWYGIAMACSRARLRLGLSGTPETGDAAKDARLRAATGPAIARVGSGALVARGWSARPRVVFHLLELAPEARGLDWAGVRRRVVADSAERNRLIARIAARAHGEGKPVLVLVDTIRQGRRVAEAIRGLGAEVEFLDGATPHGRRAAVRRGGYRHGIVVATPIFDEGVDMPQVRVLVVASGGKSAIRYLQRLGRGMRRSEGKTHVEVHDFAERGNRYLERHALRRLAICEREGFEVVFDEARLDGPVRPG